MCRKHYLIWYELNVKKLSKYLGLLSLTNLSSVRGSGLSAYHIISGNCCS
ncbi:hypothetical protein FDUTEX481_04892 [Tolypothrix sp. PCC 7601]|nr:hypothetical protein FDUTEX481_04892 [Tolypothrix sp. PCC 7601]